jgi:large subunit ribosomal protein L6
VTEGYEKKLLIIGVGYDAKLQGTKLVLNLGYSHTIDYDLPETVSAQVEKDPKGNVILTLQSPGKQLVGQVASQIRSLRPPEPYKGK